VVVIVADDMRFDFRGVLSELDGEWIDCTNAVIEVPMCGPSRAAMFKGAYSSRTGVDGNSETYKMDDGDTIATRISAAGWRTILAGKYLNDYPWTLPATYIPPGWDVWNAADSAGYQPGSLHSTDYVFGFAAEQVRATPAATPLFLWVAPTAPHLPANPPKRYASAEVSPPPIRPSFNEADVSDKPVSRQFPLLTSDEIAAIDTDRVQIARALLAVNDGIATLKRALADTGRLGTAVMFFLSDNGYLLGEHRMVKKGEAYEEASRMPFVVRWGGVGGRVEPGVISSVDLSATVCAIAGTAPPGADGVDLTPLLTRGVAVRDAAYVEPPLSSWEAARTATHKYVEHRDGSRELYDLTTDEYEMQNLADAPEHASTVAALASRLSALRP
jgi:arylsulfatase A-like enzyme